MIIEAAQAALGRLLTEPFRAVFYKTIGLTILVLIGLWFGVAFLFDSLALPTLREFLPSMPEWAGWLGFAATFVAGIALALGLGLLIAPVTALIAGFFLDDIAALVEETDYPADPPGRPLPFLTALTVSVKFLGLVILGNLLALALLLVPGVNLIAFFAVNGYLLGREFFEFAAMRFRSEDDAKALRRRHRGTIFLAGLTIAGFLAIPIVNLLTPLFAAATMVHLHKMISAREGAHVRAG